MSFSDQQNKALRAKLNRRHVKQRQQDGTTLSFVEGWHTIAEANRIFGYDSWDRQTLTPRCVWREIQRGQTVCFYTAKVRITVRAGPTITVREGIGTGLGRSPQPEIAHDLALKAAETDATKRALATFGNPFGLALYDRDQTHVTKPRAKPKEPPLRLQLHGGAEMTFEHASEFLGAVLREADHLPSTDAVYAFWQANKAAFGEFEKRADRTDNGIAPVIERLKARLRALGTEPRKIAAARAVREPTLTAEVARGPIPKEKRLRDKAHLAFVAQQPCLICGRTPSHAHHLKFAQPRAMAMKVSDEFVVPLCAVHHDQLHRTGDERAWWARNGIIEPLKHAAKLWAKSRGVVSEPKDPDRDGAGS